MAATLRACCSIKLSPCRRARRFFKPVWADATAGRWYHYAQLHHNRSRSQCHSGASRMSHITVTSRFFASSFHCEKHIPKCWAQPLHQDFGTLTWLRLQSYNAEVTKSKQHVLCSFWMSWIKFYLNPIGWQAVNISVYLQKWKLCQGNPNWVLETHCCPMQHGSEGLSLYERSGTCHLVALSFAVTLSYLTLISVFATLTLPST